MSKTLRSLGEVGAHAESVTSRSAREVNGARDLHKSKQYIVAYVAGSCHNRLYALMYNSVDTKLSI